MNENKEIVIYCAIVYPIRRMKASVFARQFVLSNESEY